MRKKSFNLIPAPPGASADLPIGRHSPWLAPLAGYSDLPFRLLCREFGAAVCETEMISAKGLFYASSASAALLSTCATDQPLVVQLFGGEPESLKEGVSLLRKSGYLNIDFNMGCPVRKVYRQKAGAWLLGETKTALEIARTMHEAATCGTEHKKARLGFKLRLGTSPGHSPLPDLALRLEDAGASWITLHPRYASQGYSGEADWESTARLAERLDIPLIASGDLLSAEAGLGCLDLTGADGLMYARGAMQNPAIFKDHFILLSGGSFSSQEKCDIIKILLRHAWYSKNFGEGRRAFAKLRSIVPRYVRIFRGSQALRARLANCVDWDSLENLIKETASMEEQP